MIAETPSLERAIGAVNDYISASSSNLSPEQTETLLEINRRLARLSVQASELIAINNKLWSMEGFELSFDPSSDTIVFSIGGAEHRLRLNRADPDVPITMNIATSGGAYHAGKEIPGNPDQENLRTELEEKVESYYQSAHRVLKLFGTIPDLANIRCPPVTRVRNNLIEHPHSGALYSFGFGSSGPRVKPMHKGEPAWNDEGLIPNTRDFVDAIVFGCRRAAP